MTKLVWTGARYSRIDSPPPRRAPRSSLPFFAPLLIAWAALLIMLFGVPRVHAQSATSRPTAPPPRVTARPAFCQVTLAPDWGRRTPLPVALVTNIQSRIGGAALDVCRAEVKNCATAYQLTGALVGQYISGDDFYGADELYYPPVQITADPNWRWTSVQHWRRRDGTLDAVPYNKGLRLTFDRRDSLTLRRVAERAAALLTERIAAQGWSPDFLFFDNCAHKSAGGPDDMLIWCDYVELVSDKVRVADRGKLPILINVAGTPADWSDAEFEQVEFLSSILRDEGRWLGFYFETAHPRVQRGDGDAFPADTAAFTRLLRAGCKVLWDVTAAPRGATSAESADNFVAAQRRLTSLARSMPTDNRPLVGANWFGALPDFLRPAAALPPDPTTDSAAPAAPPPATPAPAPAPSAGQVSNVPRRRRNITGVRLPG